MGKYKIGFSKVVISPPLFTPLAGYEYERFAKDIHDDLYARVITIKGEDTFILVELDLVCVDKCFINLLSEGINKVYKVKEENIVVNCIHTHSGPGGIINTEDSNNKGFRYIFSQYDFVLVNYMVRQIISGVSKSFNNLDEFTLAYGSSIVDGIGLNRRDRLAPMDKQLETLTFYRNDGKKIIIYNYQCHPTVMNKFNCFISADYPGETSRLLESEGDVVLAIFYNGHCGDVSTRFTRKESSFKEVKRIGDILGGEVIKLFNQDNAYKDLEEISLKTLNIDLKVKYFPPDEELKSLMKEAQEKLNVAVSNGISGGQLRIYQSIVEGFSNSIHFAEGFRGIDNITAEIKVLKMNNNFIVYIPGELFTSLGLKIKNSVHDKNILVSCYSNGYIGYIADIEAFKNGGYESSSTPLKEGEGEKLIEKIISAIKSM